MVILMPQIFLNTVEEKVKMFKEHFYVITMSIQKMHMGDISHSFIEFILGIHKAFYLN